MVQTSSEQSYQKLFNSVLVLVFHISLALLLAVLSSYAGPNDPITENLFDSFVTSQRPEIQKALAGVLPETDGFVITGPLRPQPADSLATQADRFFCKLRVLCAELDLVDSAIARLERDSAIEVIRFEVYLDYPSESVIRGFRGAFLSLTVATDTVEVTVQTIQQMRFLVWAETKTIPFERKLNRYGAALSDYLHKIDQGKIDTQPPDFKSFELPDSMDFFAPQPDYVIPGYDNYMNFLFSHRSIKTEFTSGVTAFIPSDSLEQVLIERVPLVGYPNKEWPAFQAELRKFVERGGRINFMNSLSAAGFDTLKAGEYFFAVGLSGNVRFGRELPRGEVEQIEKQTGQKPARANHAFLFPGEPILTAGTFMIELREGQPAITELTAQSGHYFYSNLSSTIREDISRRSDQYLMTLGHFLHALNVMQIPHDDLLIRKF